MKKLFLTLLMCVSVFTVSAQLKTVDLRVGVRNTFGIGGGITIGVLDFVDFAPNFNYFFTENGSTFSADADFHYNIEIDDLWEIYPLVGGCLVHGRNRDGDGDTRNKLGTNVGGGVRYFLTDQVNVFGEIKHQFLFDSDKMDKTCFAIGVNLVL